MLEIDPADRRYLLEKIVPDLMAYEHAELEGRLLSMERPTLRRLRALYDKLKGDDRKDRAH